MSYLVRCFTQLRLSLILSIFNMRLDKINRKCHGYPDIRYVFLNETRTQNYDEDIRELNYSFGRITLYVNCMRHTRVYVRTNPSKFDVLKVEFG